MLNHEVQHAPAPPELLLFLSYQPSSRLKNGHLSSPCDPQSPAPPLGPPFPAQRQTGLLHTLSPCPAWQGHCTGLLQGKFAWRGKWGNLSRCCYEQPLIPRLESIIQSPGAQKPRPGDASILILNCRYQMNHIAYISPIWSNRHVKTASVDIYHQY